MIIKVIWRIAFTNRRKTDVSPAKMLARLIVFVVDHGFIVDHLSDSRDLHELLDVVAFIPTLIDKW